MIGFCVPHFWSFHCRVEMKYTSHLNGDSNPYFHPRMVDRIGMFLVSSVYMPGVFTSASWPSFTNPAAWPSRTTSLAPFLISFLWRVKRYERISFWLGSVHSMMSMNWPFAQSISPMTVLREVMGNVIRVWCAPRRREATKYRRVLSRGRLEACPAKESP